MIWKLDKQEKINMKTKLTIHTLLLSLIFISCSPGCRHLDPEGVYKGDTLLWSADSLIVDSYNNVDDFLKWELKNRDTFKVSNLEVIHFADKLRKEYPKYQSAAIAARDIYASNKSDTNRSALLKALDDIHNIIFEIMKLKTPQPLTQ